MNHKIPVTNTTAMPMYVAGQMIPPGETRHFDADQVPPLLRPAAPEPEAEKPIDAMEELIGHSVKDITALLPSLADEQLERLGDIEQAKGDAARKTLLSAIAEQILTNAEAKAGGSVGGEAGATGAGGEGGAE